MPVQFLEQDLFPGLRIVDTVYVFVRVGVVVVVLEEKVGAGYPSNVEITIATHLANSTSAQIPCFVQLFYIQPDIPKTDNPSPQLELVSWPVCKLKRIPE